MSPEPVTARNPPFQPHIIYRPDDYSSLRYKLLQHMQARFPQWNANLAEKQGAQDFAVTLIELFSCLGDVIGFYQDCRANEAFLRTAVLPSSLIALCSLIDYRIPPGASAATLQVFLLKDGQSGVIPAGFQVKTKAKGNTPALVFETGGDVAADSARNALHLAGFDRSSKVLSAKGKTPETSVLLDQGYAGLKAGGFVLLSGGGHLIPIRLTAVTDEGTQRRITWQAGALHAGLDLAIADLIIYGRPTQEMKLAASATADQIAAGEYSAAVQHPGKLEQHDRVLFVSGSLQLPAIIVSKSGPVVTWNRAFSTAVQRSQTTIYSGGHEQFAWANPVQAGATELFVHHVGRTIEPGQLVLLSTHGSDELARIASIAGSTFHLVDPVSKAYPNGVGLYLVNLPDPQTGAGASPNTALAPLRLNAHAETLELDKSYDGLTPGSAVVVSDGELTEAYELANVMINAAGHTVLTVKHRLGKPFQIATTVVYGPFANLMHVGGYNRADGATSAGLTHITFAGAVAGFKPGCYIVLDDGVSAEGVRIAGVTTSAGATSLDLDSALVNSYSLADVLVYGNVAPVSHGETVVENALGIGDQSRANQTFTLRKSPATFVHDPTGQRGVVNTLQVFVGDERWTEVASLAGSGPDDHVYSTSIDENRFMSFTTGDGRYGAKLPTGVPVNAVYRVGLGAAANVDANTITVMSAPLPFLQSTSNPTPASGGADPDGLDQTRVSAPVTVRTLDRAVSVQDYADLALSFAGIGKARADLERSGGQPILQLTVATSGGQPLSLPLRASLAAFLEERRSPHVRLTIQDYQPWPIHLAMQVSVLPNFIQADVKQQLLTVFGPSGYFNFAARSLGETLYLSDLYALAKTVAGVDHLLITAFHPEAESTQAPSLRSRFLIPVLKAQAAMRIRPKATGSGSLVPVFQAVLPTIAVPPNAVATGGDVGDPTIGLLLIETTGGIA